MPYYLIGLQQAVKFFLLLFFGMKRRKASNNIVMPGMKNIIIRCLVSGGKFE